LMVLPATQAQPLPRHVMWLDAWTQNN
jgi:hypothetical protein